MNLGQLMSRDSFRRTISVRGLHDVRPHITFWYLKHAIPCRSKFVLDLVATSRVLSDPHFISRLEMHGTILRPPGVSQHRQTVAGCFVQQAKSTKVFVEHLRRTAGSFRRVPRQAEVYWQSWFGAKQHLVGRQAGGCMRRTVVELYQLRKVLRPFQLLLRCQGAQQAEQRSVKSFADTISLRISGRCSGLADVVVVT